MAALAPRLAVAPLLALVAAAAVVAAPARAAGPCTHRVVAASSPALENRLREATAAGFHVAAVARPDASAPERGPVVVLARPAGATRPVEPVLVWARDPVELESRVAAAAAGGARLRGVTRVPPTLLGHGFDEWLALLEPGDAAAVDYRFVLSRGNAAEWKRLEAAAAEGFRVVDVLWWADPARSALGEVVFVAERAAGSAPREVELVWEPVARLARELEKLAAKGYTADVAWTSRDYVNVLLSRPRGAPAWRGDRFEVDEDPGSASISSMSGGLVERLTFRDGQIALYDRTAPAQGYALVQGPLDPRWPGVVPSPGEAVLAERLDRAGAGGACAFDAVWQQAPGYEPELVVLLRQPGG